MLIRFRDGLTLASVLTLSLTIGSAAIAADSPENSVAQSRALLGKYCISCHGPEQQEADLDLSTLAGEASLAEDPETWIDVVQQIRSFTMPPADADQPSEAERARLVELLSAAIDRIDRQRPPRAGRVPLRRLNRVEYENTLRDLLGVELSVADDFPADDTAHGFDNVADGLSLSPLLLEKYLTAAQRALMRVVVTDPATAWYQQRASASQLRSSRQGKRRKDAEPQEAGETLTLALEQEVAAEFEIPAQDEYLIRVRAARTCDTSDPATLVLKVGGVESKVWRVEAGADEPEILEATLPLGAGTRRIALRHSWHTANVPKEVQLPEIQAHIDFIELEGPVSLAAHRRIFFIAPNNEVSEREAARQVLDRFASLAFRRAATAAELDRLLQLFERSRTAGRSYVESTRAALAAVLVSPHFLFHVERGSALRDEYGAQRLSDWELASRLSYFLWSTMPDEQLRELAAAGKLHDAEVLRGQVQRMLTDPKSAALVDNFAGQWLGLRRLETQSFDSETYPQFNESLRSAMIEEARRFFETIVREDRSVSEFITADWTWMNERLARLYGQRDIQGDHFRRVTLSDPNRGGVITMPATLAVTSLPTRTSAVKRGKWILEEILGAPPPPPPPDVPELNVTQSQSGPAPTLRERLEQHRASPACYGCHVQMDTLGLGLENFDAIGRWRKQDAGRDIDAAGTLPDGSTFTRPAELKQLLSQRQEEFARCLTEKMFVYALGRGLLREDRREVRRVAEEVLRDGGRFSTLIREIVLSYPFQYREAE